MKTKSRYILTGLLTCAALSFACVSCMQFLSNKAKSSNYVDMNTLEFVQDNPPKDGDPTATIKTTKGDIKFVLYPEYAPKTVEKFTALANSGYYDNTYIFNSQPGQYFAAGSPMKNGDLDPEKTEGNEEWEIEIHQNLWTFKGALCSLPTGEEGGFWKKLTGNSKKLNGSRFSVINSMDFTEDYKKSLLESDNDQTLAQKFIEKGGIPNLAQSVTVFGQAYEGFEVIDKLTALETSINEEELCIPIDDVMIKEIEIGVYQSNEQPAQTATEN